MQEHEKQIKNEKYFAGLDGFIWWIGVVENRQDPMALGRCQIRFFSHNTSSLTDTPTASLPWAHPTHSLNDSTFSTPKENDVVFGFFADAHSKQQPIMLGVIPGYYKDPNNQGVGFNDVRDDKTVSNAPRPLKSRKYNTDGTGISLTENTDNSTLRYPRSYQVKNTTITSIATNLNMPNNSETVSVVIDKAKNIDANVNTSVGIVWSEPFTPYSPKYPYNQVNETESGHVFEMDDTVGHERVSMIHRSGTFTEMHPDGSKVQKVTNANYEITMGSDFVHVMGISNKTVEKDFNLLVNGNNTVQVFGKINVQCFGAETTITAPTGNISITAAQTLTLHGDDVNIMAGNNINMSASASVSVDCPGGLNMLNGSISSAGNLETENGYSGVVTGLNGKTIHFVNGICVNGF